MMWPHLQHGASGNLWVKETANCKYIFMLFNGGVTYWNMETPKPLDILHTKAAQPLSKPAKLRHMLLQDWSSQTIAFGVHALAVNICH